MQVMGLISFSVDTRILNIRYRGVRFSCLQKNT